MGPSHTFTVIAQGSHELMQTFGEQLFLGPMHPTYSCSTKHALPLDSSDTQFLLHRGVTQQHASICLPSCSGFLWERNLLISAQKVLTQVLSRMEVRERMWDGPGAPWHSKMGRTQLRTCAAPKENPKHKSRSNSQTESTLWSNFTSKHFSLEIYFNVVKNRISGVV